jgi:hypothetical protein
MNVRFATHFQVRPPKVFIIRFALPNWYGGPYNGPQ